MAQTKTSTQRRSPQRARNSSAKQNSQTKRNLRGTASRNSSRSGSKPANRRSAPSPNGRASTQSVKRTVSSGAQSAAQGVSTAAQKAKTPLIAGGAALAGLAGAALINARSNRRRKVLGVSVPRPNGIKMPKPKRVKVDAQKISSAVTGAAQRADRFGRRVSSVASGVQEVSETAGKAAKKA